MNTQRTWRDEVMDEALRGFHYNENEDNFLHALRRTQPHLHTISLNADRERILEFLRTRCENFKDDLINKHLIQYQTLWVYIGWFSLSWEGQTIEVAYLPDSGTSAYALSNDIELLKKFSQQVFDFGMAPHNRVLRYSEGWERARELEKEMGTISWDDLTLEPKLLAQIRESVESFFVNKEVIRSFGFAWKRGVLLVGPPGTGKTMICKAAATALPELPFLYVRDFRERDQKESIESIFSRARKLAPCILVFEDLDSLLNDSNRTVFLNEMDGFASNDGILIIASSNHPGKIDEALLRRPSRFDRVFHLGLPELAERQLFCEKILSQPKLAEHLEDDFDVVGLAEKVAAKTDGFTPAYLKEVFASAALNCAQEGILKLDHRFYESVLNQVSELKAYLKKSKNPDSMAEMRSGDDTIGFRR